MEFVHVTSAEVFDPAPPPTTTTLLSHWVPVGVGVSVGVAVGVGVFVGVGVGLVVGEGVIVGVGVPKTSAVAKVLLMAFAWVVNCARTLFVTRMQNAPRSGVSNIYRFSFITEWGQQVESDFSFFP